jgi:hypothetical protein
MPFVELYAKIAVRVTIFVVNGEWSMVNGLLRFVFLCVPRALSVRRKMVSGGDGNQCKSVKSVRESPGLCA